MIESVTRIEPARLEDATPEILDLVAEIAAESAVLGRRLHPRTAANLADLVRLMNTYYSNLIEGHNTRPREIERALAGELDPDEGRRNLQIEAAAHVRVQAEIDRMATDGTLPEPASQEFILWLHREFYRGATEAMLRVQGAGRTFVMEPGQWRDRPEHDNAVGRHVPPSSDRVADFMQHFESRYRFAELGKAARIMAIAPAHHRLNFIHPFPDGNGRVSRLMSHAMALKADIGAQGLWSVSRGLARGLKNRTEYRSMMDHADTPRLDDLDGRGNLSQRALIDFSVWFLEICLDQIRFMSDMFDLNNLERRLRALVAQSESLKPEAAELLAEALIRGEFGRGEIERITGLPERTARRVLKDVIELGLLDSETEKGRVFLKFPSSSLDILFPRLFPLT